MNQIVNQKFQFKSPFFFLMICSLLFMLIFFLDGVVWSKEKINISLIFFSFVLASFLMLFDKKRCDLLSMPLVNPRIIFQFSVQGTLLFYISKTQYQLVKFFPFILFGILFGYIFEIAINLLFKRAFKIGLYIIPVVLSINLFLKFNPNDYLFFLIIIALAIISKNFLVYKNRSGWAHIINPSVFAIFTLEVASLAIPSVHSITNVRNLLEVPYFDLLLMTIAPLTLWLPNAFLITISGVGSLLLLDYLARQFTGLSLMVGLARGQILLAYCLLITDPMTSPRSNIGKVLYGIIYTFILCAVYFLLILSFKSYSEYAKILAAPFVNILAPYIDDYCQKFKSIELKINNINFIKLRVSILAVYIVGILFLYEKVLILYPAPYLMASYPKISFNPVKIDYIPLFVEDLDKFNYPVWKSNNTVGEDYRSFFKHLIQ